ncbi:MAG: 30S ribosomal protein S1 [candidate division Zixibacteria bacterium SM23_73_2]|nr:MAG: 30S ribosomal protein S1 [candidate division Zixibacteria bacterium SM23_73_2]
MSLAELEDKEYTQEEYQELLQLYEDTMPQIKEGELVKGKVMGITKEDVIVDVGFKSEGIIPISEFTGPLNIKVGDEIDVYLEAIEDQDGQLVLSKQKADFMMVWDKIREAYDRGDLVEGFLERRIKGGMVVSLMGVDAFLPGSQIALRQIPDFDALVGKKMMLKIIKLNKPRRNIVVSRRAVLEQERETQRTQLLAEIEPGQTKEGVVKNITDFGVFIDLGGVDGLLHITDMSWGRISHPSELVALGDTIKVKILDFDKKAGRVSLGLKQLTPYPWEDIEKRYPLDKKVRGKVVSITDYGAFVELEKGIEGLIHISEMSWTKHIRHPSKVVAIGDMVDAVVLSVDKQNEKISLGLKQIEPDPWENIENKYPRNSKIVGKVRNLTAFGVFVELEEGIDGLIHISDLSWTKRVQHPAEVVRRGEKIEAVVLSIDKDNRRISLGHKQVKSDPWPQYSRKFSEGQEVTGQITKLTDRGVVIKLEDELEGFVPTSQLGKDDITKPIEAFSEGDVLPMRVIEFDRPTRKIVLSVTEYYKGREKTELEAFLAKHPTKTQKVEEVVEEVPKIDFEKEKKQAEAETEVKEEEKKAVPETEEKKPEPESPETEQEKPEEVPPEESEDKSK